jgi:hypothetical protein
VIDVGPAYRYSFDAGATPIDPAFDGENLYVPLVLQGKVAVIRARTGRLVRTVTLDPSSFPSSAAYAGVRVWVTTNAGVDVVNPEDGTFESFAFGVQNRHIAVCNGYVYICTPTLGQVRCFPVNITSATPAQTWTIPTCNGIATDGTSVFVSATSVGGIYRITGTDAVATLARTTGGQPRKIVIGNGTAYVADGATNKIYSFATDGSGTVTTNTVGSAAPSSMTFDGEHLIATTQSGAITAYNASDFSVVKTGQLTTGTDSLVFDGRNVWVLNSFGSWMEKR